MSDTAAIQAMLDRVPSAAPQCVVIPPGTYTIDVPLSVTYATNTYSGGLLAYGVCLKSVIRDGAPVLTISVGNGIVARGQKFCGFDIVGCNKEGHGLVLASTGGLYNFVFRDIGIEQVGGDGVNATGGIFEGYFENVRPRNNGGNGATLGCGTLGNVMSTVAWIGGSCGQNGKHGMELVNNTYDVKIRDTYFLLNGLSGLHLPNGLSLIEGGGFENNQQSLQGTATGPAISGGNFITAIGVTEGAETINGLRQQTSLLDGFYSVGEVVLIGCHTYSGIGKLTGACRLNVIGSS